MDDESKLIVERLTRALQEVEGIERSYDKAHALCQIATSWAEVDQKKAEDVFDRAIEVIQRVEDGVAIKHEYDTIFQDNTYDKAKALGEIATALAKVNPKKGAEAFGKALALAERIPYANKKAEILHAITLELAKVDLEKG
jgi:hypothetical protein